MKKRLLASLLSLCLIVGLLPTAVLAAEEETGGVLPPVCTCEAHCAEGAVDETCPVCTVDYTACTYTAPVEPEKEPTKEPAEEPEVPVCAGLEGCDDDTHAEGCPLYVAPVEPEIPLTALTPAETANEDAAAAGELEADAAPLAADGMSGTCGATESDKVTWTLTPNNGNPTTYTLTISGTGDMKDFDVATGNGANKAPWFTALNGSTTSITAVTIEDGITSIGDYALSKLSNLKTINGNDTSTTKKIVFPAQLTSWGYSLNGSGLSGVLSFPENCQLEDENSLNIFGNNNITGVDWTNYPLTSIPAHWTEYGTAHTALTDLGLGTIPSTVTSVGEYAFKNFQGTSIEIPDTSIQYGVGTFVNSKLTHATINVEKENSALSEDMFSSNTALTAVNFVGNNLKKIPAGTFHGTKLSSLVIPYGVATIESNSTTTKEHASTFGIGSSQTNLDTAVAFVFPSTLTNIAVHNNQDELFGNRTASNVIILAPASFEWGTIDGGLKNIGSGITIGKGFNGLYRYALATTATYGDAVKVFSVTNSSNEACTLPECFGTISYEIADETVLNSELKAVSVGNTRVEVFITKSGADTKTKIAETTINVTPKEIKVSMADKTEAYNEQSHTIEAQPAEGGTLPTDLELVYSYKESTAGENTYIHVAPTHPGTYTVKVESGNPNYKLIGTTTATLTISEPTQAEDMSDQVAVTVPSLVYDGTAKAYTAAYAGITDWTIAYYDTEGTKLDSAPVNAGDYWVTINGESENKAVYASITKSFTVTPAQLVIKADDQSIRVGSTLPKYTYTVTGLVSGETLRTEPTLTCDADGQTAGTYTIKASGADAGANYTVSYVDGTLTVSKRSSGGGGSGSSSGDYIVSVDSDKHGTVTVSPKRADKGDTVTITVKPDKGYELDELTVTDKSGDKITLTEKADNKFTFKMPDSKVTVEASFKQVETEPEATAFVDVPADAYYADAVAWAVKEGITSGTSDTTFSPDMSCTRAQMVTFLWRANGSPVVNYAMSFTDVPADAYYAEAVRWAVSEGITTGTTATTFSPNATLTRGQTVTFIYRNVQAQGGGFTGSWMFPCPFTDVPADAYYFESVQWCAMKNITSGTSATTFSPDATCTRAQIVTFMYRAD